MVLMVAPHAIKRTITAIKQINQAERIAVIKSKIEHYKKTGNARKLAIYESKL